MLFFRKLKLRLAPKVLSCMFAALALSAQSFAMAQSEPVTLVVYQEDGKISEQLNMPIYSWTAPQAPPKGIVLAVHGLAMHGKSFDRLGRTLAAEGFMVYATDVRGYGRCVDDARTCKIANCKHKIDYPKSYGDLVRLGQTLRELHPSLPVFAIGESMGAAMCIHLAASNPELVDALVLSSPAVKRRSLIDPYLLLNAGIVMSNPRAQLDLMPFVRRYCSDDPRVIEEKEHDPLLRRHLSAYELLKATVEIRRTITYVPSINAETPVLVMQGGGDRVLRAEAVMTLLSKLQSKDQTVKWFSHRGHILLETDYVKPDTMEAVVSWVNAHVASPMIQSKLKKAPDYIATHLESGLTWGPGGVQHAEFHVRLDPNLEMDQ